MLDRVGGADVGLAHDRPHSLPFGNRSALALLQVLLDALSLAEQEGDVLVRGVDEPGDLASWPSLKLTAMCRAQDDPAKLLSRACKFAHIAVPAHVTHTIPDEDWVSKSMQEIAPIHARCSGPIC